MQAVLDFRSAVPARSYRPLFPLPPAVRQLGVIPDPDAIWPGDLILVSPHEPTSIQRGIQRTQLNGGYDAEDARWTHAAVYLGSEFRLCEAVRTGVHLGTLLDYVPDHLIRIRRPDGIGREQAWQIAVQAVMRLGNKYSWRTIFNLRRRAAMGWWRQYSQSAHAGDRRICSELYGDAYSAIVDRTLINPLGRETTPAFLSLTPKLRDVTVEWCSVASPGDSAGRS